MHRKSSSRYSASEPAAVASRSSMRRIRRPLVMTSDTLASAYALERRSPYLARDLIEFSLIMKARSSEDSRSVAG
ncbi:hypothetical protein [Streptomyces sp. NPDC005301]